MRIVVFGLSYVGTVTAALLAECDNAVVGIDVNPVKAESIRSGESPVVEPQLSEIIAKTVERGNLTAVSDPSETLDWQVAFVCVGTPSGSGGQLDSSALTMVLDQIGSQIKQRSDYPVVVIRSTVAPHILDEIVVPQLASSTGESPGNNYGIVMMPEFLREGVVVQRF